MLDIDGTETLVNAIIERMEVECVRPFAVYQTVKGPVDSMGVYFLCQAEGNLLNVGHDTVNPQWVPVEKIISWMEEDESKISWIDRAGLLYYLAQNRFVTDE